MKQSHDVAELQAIARRVRRKIVQMIGEAKSGHPGGSLSAVEILTTLYFDVMRHHPGRPAWPDRDPFILSEGDAPPVLHCLLEETRDTPPGQLNTPSRLGAIFQGP